MRFTFKDFDLGTLIHNEKDNLKLIITGLGGIATFFASGIANPILNAAVSSVCAGVIALLLSALDYWQSK